MIPLVLGTNLENLASLSTITETAISNYAGFTHELNYQPDGGLSPIADIPDIPPQGVGDDFDCPDNFWRSSFLQNPKKIRWERMPNF